MYAVYMGKGVGGDWISDNVMPANRLTEHEGGGREERILIAQCCSGVQRSQKVKPLLSVGNKHTHTHTHIHTHTHTHIYIYIYII